MLHCTDFLKTLFDHKITLTIFIETRLSFENSDSLNGQNVPTSTKIYEEEPTKLYSSQRRQLHLSKSLEKPEPIVVDVTHQNSANNLEQTEKLSECEKSFIEDATQTERRVSFIHKEDENEKSKVSRKDNNKVEFDDSTSESDEMDETKNNKPTKAMEESTDEESSCSTDESEKKDDNNKNGK